MNVDSQIGKIG